jgi:hypothetical protein
MIAAAVCMGLCGDSARGQCQRWGAEFSTGPNCTVNALTVFDSGNGPELLAGGCFGEIINGPFNANGIARWTGWEWQAIAAGVNDEVLALHVFDDGNGPLLYLGGRFTVADGNFVYRIAKCDGSFYQPLAPGGAGGFQGPNGASVLALTTFDDGFGPALYAGGALPSSNGVAINHVAKWTGTQWVPLGSGLSASGYVSEFEVFDDGSGPALFVGGEYTFAGGMPASGLAKWDGAVWTPIGVGVIPGALALKAWDDGSGPALYIGTGTATLPGGGATFGIVKWDGTTWSDVGGGMNGVALSLAVHDDGSGEALYVGGDQTLAGGIPAKRIARWDGIRWSTLGDGVQHQISPVNAMVIHDAGGGGRPDLYLGGGFNQVANLTSHHVARWISCEDSVDTFCFGDGSFAACPCQQSGGGPPNYGLSGRGCNNSQNTGGALLVANGTPVPDSIVLRATGELPTALTIFLQGDQLMAVPTPFGDGLRCIGGNLKRLYTKAASAGTARAPVAGEPSVTARSAALGDPIAPGSTRCYQTYYRDPNPNVPICTPPLGSTFNSSNGVRIVW